MGSGHGALVVFYRGRVAVAQGVVFVALLPLRSFAHWPPLLGFAFPCPRATVGVSPDRPAEHGLPTLQAISSIHPSAWKENSGKSTSRLVNMLNAGSSDGVLDV